MHFTKLTFLFAWTCMILFVSCEKENQNPEPSCFDGIMNNGELGVDCGGPCPPCSNTAPPFLLAVFNGQLTNFPNINVQYGDTIYINAVTDSVQVNLIFKNLITPNENNELYPLVPNLAPYVVYNGVQYTQTDPTYSVVVLTENADNKISGLFQLILPHGLNNMDTLKVINGTFENLAY